MITWTRTEKTIGKNALKTGLSIYTSECGRFVIRQTRGGWTATKTYYLLDVDGKPAPRSFRESDTLRDAKDAAEMVLNPEYEPV